MGCNREQLKRKVNGILDYNETHKIGKTLHNGDIKSENASKETKTNGDHNNAATSNGLSVNSVSSSMDSCIRDIMMNSNCDPKVSGQKLNSRPASPLMKLMNMDSPFPASEAINKSGIDLSAGDLPLSNLLKCTADYVRTVKKQEDLKSLDYSSTVGSPRPSLQTSSNKSIALILSDIANQNVSSIVKPANDVVSQLKSSNGSASRPINADFNSLNIGSPNSIGSSHSTESNEEVEVSSKPYKFVTQEEMEKTLGKFFLLYHFEYKVQYYKIFRDTTGF